MRRTQLLVVSVTLSWAGCVSTSNDNQGDGVADGVAEDPENTPVDPDGPTPEPPTEPGDGDGDGDGDGATFIAPTDGMYGSTCDPFLQDCPERQKCVPVQSVGDTWDANRCVDVIGDASVGEPCQYGGAVAGWDTCDENSWCWNVEWVDGEGWGHCAELCGGNANNPLCPAGSSCSISCAGTINICIPNCDPLLQDCDGLGCFWAGTSFECIFATQDIPTGEPCGYINDCAPGNLCTNADVLPGCEGASCCAAFCDLDAPDCAIEGTECMPFFTEGEAPPGQENVGVCQVP